MNYLVIEKNDRLVKKIREVRKHLALKKTLTPEGDYRIFHRNLIECKRIFGNFNSIQNWLKEIIADSMAFFVVNKRFDKAYFVVETFEIEKNDVKLMMYNLINTGKIDYNRDSVEKIYREKLILEVGYSIQKYFGENFGLVEMDSISHYAEKQEKIQEFENSLNKEFGNLLNMNRMRMCIRDLVRNLRKPLYELQGSMGFPTLKEEEQESVKEIIDSCDRILKKIKVKYLEEKALQES